MKKLFFLSLVLWWAEKGEAVEPNKHFSITSDDFKDRGAIPSSYTCDGENKSPRLAWNGAPEGTQSFVLICDDPDAPAGTFVHWVVYNIPATSSGMPRGVPVDKKLSDGSLQGTTSFGSVGFGGPCPPSGEHRYFFKLYALDNSLSLPAGATKEQVLEAMKGHIKAQTELVGVYARKKK